MRAVGLALVSVSAVGLGFTYADQAALVPLLAAEISLSDLQIGLLSASLFASYIAVTLVTTGLPDRLGPKPVIAAGLAAAALGTALFGVAPTFAVLIVAKLVQGVRLRARVRRGRALHRGSLRCGPTALRARPLWRRLPARVRPRAGRDAAGRNEPRRLARVVRTRNARPRGPLHHLAQRTCRLRRAP